MGRLIDADKNREDFKKTLYSILKDDFSTSKVKFNKIMTAFDSMPTAYSVDKVVEELIALNKNYNDGINLYEEVAEIPTEEAIEIVKQGGVSDDTDNMCEWKYTKEIMDNAEFKVGCNTNALKRGVVPNNFSYHDFKYCPYCGKKILCKE